MPIDDLALQTKLAFDFVQRLYDETALLIQEIESAFAAVPEQFVIGRPSGYGIITRRSSGLEPSNVKRWPLRKLGVFLVPESRTSLEGGQTRTPVDQPVLYLRVLLDEYRRARFGGVELEAPTVIFGVFTAITLKKKFRKFEDLMSHFEYYEAGVFDELPTVRYEDGYVSVEGTFEAAPLFALADRAALERLVVTPALALYRRLAGGAGVGGTPTT